MTGSMAQVEQGPAVAAGHHDARNPGGPAQLGGHCRTQASQRVAGGADRGEPGGLDLEIFTPARRPGLVGQGAEKAGATGVAAIEGALARQMHPQPAVDMEKALDLMGEVRVLMKEL